MTTYKGTAGSDVIDGPSLAGDRDWIDGLAGDDTVTLGPNQTFVSGLGNDTIKGTGTSQYGLWFATSTAFVDLAKGYAIDGFGGTDQLSGIGTIHMSGLGGTVIGSGADETIFAFGGEKQLDLGGGSDRVIYYQQPSSNYEIAKTANGYQLKNIPSGTTDSLANVEYIEFSDKVINVAYDGAAVRAAFKYTAYKFDESRVAPGYTYAGVYTPPSLVAWFPQAPYTLDLDKDGKLDVIVPMNVGYATGLDTRVPFIALTGKSGKLGFDVSINAQMPITAGARREAEIYLGAIKTTAVVTVAHDTFDGRLADLTLIATGMESVGATSPIKFPVLPSALSGRDLAVDAHSMAVGDINGDSLQDVLVGDWHNSQGAYALLQQSDGKFVLSRSGFFTSITYNWPMEHAQAGQGNLLIDLALVDVNHDGFDDLIAGWGHGSTHSYVFLNDHGTFSTTNKIALPDSVYGVDNQLHLKTFSYDFDRDGNLDLAVVRSRYVPYYGGDYVQLLRGDGKGNFSDVTASNIDNPMLDAFGGRLQCTDHWQLLDVNADGAMDFVGQRIVGSSDPIIYLNDGTGKFKVLQIPVDAAVGSITQWGDFNADGKLEFIAFRPSDSSTGALTTYHFNVFELLAPAFGDSLVKTGTSENDILVGSAEANILNGRGGNDYLDGGAGLDIAFFSGTRDDHSLTKSGQDWIVSSTADGTDTLKNIERLKFSDVTVALDVAGTAGQAYRIYQAAFNRAPDAAGLGYWISVMDSGATLNNIAQSFVDSPEFKALYGTNPTNAQVVAKMYDNVLHRTPDQAGYDYWVGVLSRGEASVAAVLATFGESPENVAALVGVVGDGFVFTPYGG